MSLRVLTLTILLTAFHTGTPAAEFSLTQRVPVTTSRVKGWPDGPPPYQAKRLFPEITFRQPLHIIKEPGTERLIVTERFGKILVMTHDQTQKQAELFLDVGREAYSVCFHPKYRQNGFLYVFSNGKIDGVTKNRVSRFTMRRQLPFRPIPESELVILEWESNGHNGHFLTFGPDGLLWISAGDGTTGMDPKLDAQNIANVRGTLMRIDVDHPTEQRPYSIPEGNPFVDHPNAKPEIWAFGFRNPYRFTFHPENHSLWMADIGQDAWEMIYEVKRGGNYGWSIMEGPAPLNATRQKGPGPIIPPVVSHPHSEMRSITGGFFYRGEKFPELRGAYIYGDYDTRRVFAMRYDFDRKKVTWKKELARTKYRVISIGEDQDREILIAAFGGEIFTLEPTPPPTEPLPPFPRKLSETGLFQDVAKYDPMPGVVPYSVNSPLWSDGAFKERHVMIPGDAQVQYQKTRAWTFPTETVLVKTFSLETEAGNPQSRRRIETRLLTLHPNGEWEGYSYRWNEAQTDAELVSSAGDNHTLTIRDETTEDGQRQQTWRFPSRAECMVCHTREARYVLGLTTLQMNRPHKYGSAEANQIDVWRRIGLFSNEVPESVAKLPSLPDPHDSTQPLESRVRSYLHSNCWHCHVVNGGGNARMELHFGKSREQAKIFDEKPNHATFGIADARLIAPGSPKRSLILHRMRHRKTGHMPPVGTNLIDQQGIDLLRKYIESLPVEP